MCSAIPHHPLSPSKPAYSDVQIRAAEDLDALGELEWMDDMCDGADVNDNTDSGDKADTFAHSCLVILPGGVGTCFETFKMPPSRFF